MQQLSGTDHVSLFSERRAMYNHVAALSIYDVSTAPGGKVRFKDILQHFEQRLYLHPVFRQKLVSVPFGLDRPYWVASGDIDLDFHVRHIALPAPGDWRQLMIQVARLHSRPLDRSKPLWEVYVIEGLDNIPNLPPGAFAVLLKIHHAVVDGMAAIHLFEQLHADSPEIKGAKPVQSVVVDRDPLAVEIAAQALMHAVQRVGKVSRLTTTIARRVLNARLEAIGRAAPDSADALAKLGKVPKTRFSERVSGNRVVDGFGMPISRIKRIRDKVPGITLNDVFIAVAGGGVRNYLLAKHELPEETLRALMPISLRTDASAGGNDVAGVPVPVRSDIADPIERLRAAHEGARASKANAETLGLDLLKNLLDILPPPVVNFALEKFMLPSINMTVSNVRGPDKPIYLAGAKAMCLYPVSIPGDGGGLNITGVSYNRVMWVSAVSCRNMMPDPGFFLECLRGAWLELLAAADALDPPVVVAGSQKPPAKTPTRKSVKRTVKPAARAKSAAKSGGRRTSA
ncbi:MAG: wax ester/triacylglycerol synthase family O-acyltransferase [Rhodocyclaceae bacterium]|nr:wax ester/triacylglycerol synthase family O-acyltransferase [Rhodocyclaceae bacterium]